MDRIEHGERPKWAGELWSQIEPYIIRDKEGIIFRDPVTGEHIEHGRPPECLSQDTISRVGFDTLRRLGAADRLDVRLLFGSHSDQGDFDWVVNDHSKAFDDANLVAIEADWHADFDEELELWVAPRTLVTRPKFQEHQLDWLAERGLPVLPCDIDGPEDELRVALKGLFEVGVQAGKHRSELTDLEYAKIVTTAHTLYQYIREWGMVGQLGYWLATLEARGELPAGKLRVPFMLGAWHEPIAIKFIDATGHLPDIYRTTSMCEYGRIAAYGMHYARLESDQLTVPPPY